MWTVSVLHSWIWNEQFLLHLDLNWFYLLLPPTISGVPFILRRGALDIQSTLLFTDKAVQPSLQGLKGAQLWQLLGSKNKNNNDWDEAEAITFGGEPAKTAVPIPFTKELSSRQMMRVTGFHFLFFPHHFTDFFLYLKAYLLQSLNSCKNLFFFFFFLLVEIALTAFSTLGECRIFV